MKANDFLYQSSSPSSDTTDCDESLPNNYSFDALDLDEIELTEEQIKIIAYEQVSASLDED